MYLKTWLLFLLFVPVALFAGNDKLFEISPKQYKEGALLEKSAKLAIVNEGLNSVSELPELPLRAHTFYLRHKRGPKEFFWYVGRLDDEKYDKLHAFSMKENHLKPADVIYTRFYGSQKFKAFQDEADIYFDKEYVYSTRIATLYFMKNGRWEMLKETDRPSVISIDTSMTDLQVTSLTKRLNRKVDKIYPVKPGLYAFDFTAPGYLPYVDVINVPKAEIVSLNPQMVALDIDSVISVKTDLTLDAVDKAESLEEVEVLYDRFASEVMPVLALVDTNAFEKKYPELKTALSLDVPEELPEYKAYVEWYNNRRAESRNLWRANKLGMVGVLDENLRNKLDSLQRQPLSGTMVPEKIEPIFEAVPGSEEKRISAMRLTFGKEFDRFDVVWVGNAEGVVPDTLYSILDVASSVAAHMTLESNKPVWIYEDGKLVGRHHYRYTKLNLIIDDETYVCSGKFILPSYIADQPEVQEWVSKRPVGSDRPVVIDSVQTLAADSAQPVVADSAQPVVVDTIQPAVVDTVQPAVVDTIQPIVVDSAKLASSSVDSVETAVDTASAEIAVTDVATTEDSAAQPEILPVAQPETPSEVAYEDDEDEVEPQFGAKPLPRILKDVARGTVALIDSGSFRYKGKVVSLSPFAIHTTEVTQQFYQEVMDRSKENRRKDRSSFVDPQKPVHNISWYDAQKFCQAIGGDLPSEAQWEFAGRADNNEGALWNLDENPDAGVYAVYRENSYKQLKGTPGYGPQVVASKKPNEWGIYDMSGNVAEWTKDRYFMFSLYVEPSNPSGAWMGSHKVYKGGSWKDREKYLNLTARDDEDPRYWSDGIGFRCAFPRSVFEEK